MRALYHLLSFAFLAVSGGNAVAGSVPSVRVIDEAGRDILSERVQEGNVCVLEAQKSSDRLSNDSEVKEVIEQLRAVSNRDTVSFRLVLTEDYGGQNNAIRLSVAASNSDYEQRRPQSAPYIPSYSNYRQSKPGLFAPSRDKHMYADYKRQDAQRAQDIIESQQYFYEAQKKYDAANGPIYVTLSPAKGSYKQMLANGSCSFKKDELLNAIAQKSGSKKEYANSIALKQCQDQANLWAKEYNAIQSKVSQLPEQWLADVKDKLDPGTPVRVVFVNNWKHNGLSHSTFKFQLTHGICPAF
jgi:hypothetical protein